MTDLFDLDTGATFSDCGGYRYRLWRQWDASKPTIAFLMLNPSTADAQDNDPTVERCQRRAAALGCGGLVLINLFALVSTDPAGLYGAGVEPVGPENDRYIDEEARVASSVVCAWGKHAAHMGRGMQVAQRLRAMGVPLLALGFNRDGSPKHPLYIAYDTPLVPWQT